MESLDSFQILKRTVEKLLGIQCSQYKEDYIRRRIQSRMSSVRISEYPAYRALLSSSREEQELLRNALTINVTRFLRDPQVFDCIRREVFPEMMQRKMRIRIWCAGCSSGEESYTLAMIAHGLQALHRGLEVTILATDIDREVLKRAEAGIYDRKALENLDAGQIRRHFSLKPDGKYEVKPHLRALVRFRWHDLMSGKPISGYLDMISCRNVIIYFTESQKNDLARLFHGALSSDGFFIMGKTEYLAREVENLFVPFNLPEKIYRKRG